MDAIIKNVKRVESNTKILSAVEHRNVKDDSVLYQFLCCNRCYQKETWKIKEEFVNT